MPQDTVTGTVRTEPALHQFDGPDGKFERRWRTGPVIRRLYPSFNPPQRQVRPIRPGFGRETEGVNRPLDSALQPRQRLGIVFDGGPQHLWPRPVGEKPQRPQTQAHRIHTDERVFEAGQQRRNRCRRGIPQKAQGQMQLVRRGPTHAPRWPARSRLTRQTRRFVACCRRQGGSDKETQRRGYRVQRAPQALRQALR